MKSITERRADLYMHIKQAEKQLNKAANAVIVFGATEEKQLEMAEDILKSVISYLTDCSPYTFSEMCSTNKEETP